MKTPFIERLIVITALMAVALSIFFFVSNKPIYILPLWIIMGNLSLAFYIFLQDYKNEMKRAFMYFVVSISVWGLGVYVVNNIKDSLSVVLWGRYLYAGVVFVPSSFLVFSTLFPKIPSDWDLKRKIITYLPSWIFLLLLPTDLLINQVIYEQPVPVITFGSLYPLFGIFLVGYFIAAFIRMGRSYFSFEGYEKKQIRFLITGITVTFIVAATTNLFLPLIGYPQYFSIGPLFCFVIVSFLGYGLLKEKVADLYLILQNAVVYFMASVAIVGIYSFVAILSGQNIMYFTQWETMLAMVVSAFVVSVTFQPVTEIIQGITSKLFANKLHEELLNIKNYNETILNNMPLCVLATEMSGEIAMMNLAAEKLLGRSAVELNAPLAELVKKTISGKEVSDYEIVVYTLENQAVPVSISTRLLTNIHGERIGVQMVIHDLTEIKKLEEQMRRGDKLAALGTMAAGMAHEIKNPLSSIKVLTQLMSKKFNEPEYKNKFVEIMPREISRIDRIVDSILGYVRASKPIYEKISIKNSVQESLSFLEDQIFQKNINAAVSIAELPWIEADAQQFFQVFTNLLQNAIHAVDKGGKISVSAAIINDEGEKLVVEISDNGCGIAKEHLSRLFDPFFTMRYGGTGLGLTIVHGIIEAHKGIIEVESTLGSGSTFRLTIPVSQPQRKT